MPLADWAHMLPVVGMCPSHPLGRIVGIVLLGGCTTTILPLGSACGVRELATQWVNGAPLYRQSPPMGPGRPQPPRQIYQ